ncbi:MAG: SRPBCC family protein [Gammaproteobacteria bacterium]|nr:SRPBCC family protein [Gammaproteobacteria bacterium]
MSKVRMSTEIPVPADQLWSLIGGFNALPDWHPAVEKSELQGEQGTVRKLTLAGGGQLVERLVSANDKERVYTYEIVNGPLPVMNYKATIKVSENEDGSSSIVEWSSEFEPVAIETDAVKAIQGIYQTGFENLRKIFGG